MKYLHLIILSIFIFFSCKNESPKDTVIPTPTPSKNTTIDETKQMIDLLDDIYQKTNFDGHPYANLENAVIMQKKLAAMSQQGTMDWTLLTKYAIELVDAGKTQDALNTFQSLFENVGQFQKVDNSSLLFYKMWAITWMRKGEQENCIINHTGESCIFPIKGKGIHVKKEGSQNAIKLYKQILQKHPDDLESQWLLNVAYMTLGEYPNNVPTKFLLPPSQIKSDYALPEFKNIAMEVGLDANTLAGGSVVDDMNNDGYLDILCSSWGMKDQLHFYINNGDGTFSNKTQQAKLMGLTGGLNMTHGDYNNDGFVDVFVLRGGWNPSLQRGIQPNSLLKNNGDGTFTDVTIKSGVYSLHPTQTAVWLDFNLDGNLDLFVGNENTNPSEPHPCEFYMNNGDGTFTDIISNLKLDVNGYVKGVNSGDVNNDGYPDIYISYLNAVNVLLLNRGGNNISDWKFEKVSSKAGIEKPKSSFPTWFFDINNDGNEDIFVAAYDKFALTDQAGEVAASYLGKPFKGEHPRIYLNKGNETFQDVTNEKGLNKAIHTMGCNYGDLDNDGFLDFYLGTGAPDLRSIVPNRMFRNNAGKTFQDVTTSGRFGLIQKGHGVSFADIDNDGDQDIYTVVGGAKSGDNFQNAFFENPGSNNNWIVIQLEGTTANRSAIGSRIHLEVEMNDGNIQHIYNTVSPGASFGANSLQQEIGLGNAKTIKSVKVNWANKDNSYIDYGSIPMKVKVLLKEDEKKFKLLNYKSFTFQKQSGGHHHH